MLGSGFTTDGGEVGANRDLLPLVAAPRRVAASSLVQVVALLVAFPFAALAQALPVPTPKNVVLPNYDNVLVGLTQGLEATAFIARVDDAAATFYNPAGLALAKKTSLDASSNGYIWTRLGSEALGQTISTSRVDNTPGFFGAVLGEGIINNEHLRLGFSVTRSVAWMPGAIDQSIQAGGNQLLNYASTVNFSTLTPTVGIGFAPGGPVRLGLSVGVAYTSYSNNETFSGNVLVSGQPVPFLSTVRANVNVWDLVFSGGVQWDVTKDLTLGAVVTTPGLRITSGSLVTYQATLTQPGATSDSFFRDDSASADYKLPVAVGLGLAYKFGPAQAEIDFRYHGGTGSYALYHSDRPIQLSVHNADGTITNSTQPFPDSTFSGRRIVNVSVGGRYQASKAFTLHAGFLSALSPIDDPTISAFRKANLYAVTFGVSFSSQHFSASLGAAVEWGSSDPVQLGATAQPVSDSLDVKSFTLLYALKYQF
jgi:hypothetical protein